MDLKIIRSSKYVPLYKCKTTYFLWGNNLCCHAYYPSEQQKKKVYLCFSSNVVRFIGMDSESLVEPIEDLKITATVQDISGVDIEDVEN